MRSTDVVVEVLDERRTVMGVSTIVVHDVASVDGEVVEDTYDWFAQDSAGNVWYFGEDTTSYDADGTSSTKGAWEAGVGGALPGHRDARRAGGDRQRAIARSTCPGRPRTWAR